MCITMLRCLVESRTSRSSHAKSNVAVLRHLAQDAAPIFLGASWTQLIAIAIDKATDGTPDDDNSAEIACFFGAALLIHFAGMIILLRTRGWRLQGIITHTVTETTNFSWKNLAVAIIFSAPHDEVVLFSLFLGVVFIAIVVVYLGGFLRQVVIPHCCASGESAAWLLTQRKDEVLLTSYEFHVFALAIAYTLTQQIYSAITGEYWSFESEHHKEEDDGDDDDRGAHRIDFGFLFLIIFLIAVYTAVVGYIQTFTDPHQEYVLEDEHNPVRRGEVRPTQLGRWRAQRRRRRRLQRQQQQQQQAAVDVSGANGAGTAAPVDPSPPDVQWMQPVGTLATVQPTAEVDVEESRHNVQNNNESVNDEESAALAGREPFSYREMMIHKVDKVCHMCWGILCLNFGAFCVAQVQPRCCFWELGTVTMHAYSGLFNASMASSVGVWWFLYAQLVGSYVFGESQVARFLSSLVFAIITTLIALYVISRAHIKLARKLGTHFRRRRYQLRIVALRLATGWAWEDVIAQALDFLDDDNFTIQFGARFLAAALATVVAFTATYLRLRYKERRAAAAADLARVAALEGQDGGNVGADSNDDSDDDDDDVDGFGEYGLASDDVLSSADEGSDDENDGDGTDEYKVYDADQSGNEEAVVPSPLAAAAQEPTDEENTARSAPAPAPASGSAAGDEVIDRDGNLSERLLA